MRDLRILAREALPVIVLDIPTVIRYTRPSPSKPTCPGYAGMNPASIVSFATEAEVQQAGYRKAKNCP